MPGKCAAPWLQGFDADVLDAAHGMPIDALLEDFNSRAREAGFVTGAGKPLQFVPQEQLAQGVAYESWIAQTGCVPMRDNLHDRYNAMLWLSAPRTKAQLNGLQANAIAQQAAGQMRGGLRDAATIWDENLAVIVATRHADVLRDALGRHDWRLLFLTMRHCWHADWQVLMFGHALLEKLHHPFKAITAHVVVKRDESSANANPGVQPALRWPQLDGLLADTLSESLRPAMFHHLPVLGVPGWDAANEHPVFYEDAGVFRPPRG